jgi:peptide/nickel transport system ATP-binding protein
MLHSFPTLRGPRHRMTGIPGSPPDLRDIPPGCAFHPRCPLAYESCSTIMPTLRRSAEETPDQLVSCHLYDVALSSERVPTNADFATSYEAAYAQSTFRRR